MAVRKAETDEMNGVSNFEYIFEWFERNQDNQIDAQTLWKSVQNFGLEKEFPQHLVTDMMKWTGKEVLSRRGFHRVLATSFGMI